ATKDAKSIKPRSGIQVTADLVLAVAAPVFFVALAIVTSGLIDQILFQQSLIKVAASRQMVAEEFGYAERPVDMSALLAGFVVVAVVGITASKIVNINRFSLHALYRNRLLSAVFGASYPRTAQWRMLCNDFDELSKC